MRPESFQSKSLRSRLRRGLVAALLLLVVAAGFFIWLWLQPPKPLVAVVTIAGAGPKIAATSLSDPFGVAADGDGNIFVSDGKSGCVYRIDKKGLTEAIAEHLVMPSAIALGPDGTLVVANTGANTIARVDPKRFNPNIRLDTDGPINFDFIAGSVKESGDADGPASKARFNAPVGVAIGKDGTIYVADTYNDHIRMITADRQVRTLAGGSEPGFRDGKGAEARFDTPCGIAVARDGALLVADTGNHRIRRVTIDGTVTTLAGTGAADERDGPPLEAAFNEPTAITIRDENSFYVADAAGNSVRLCEFGNQPDHPPAVRTLAGGYPLGLNDGELSAVKLNRPTGLAVISGWRKNALVFADSGNGLVRAFVSEGSKLGFRSKPETALLKADEIRAALPPRWPFDPPNARREIAGTFGEVRGERLPEHDAWFHNGLDIPGAYGEAVRAIYTERVSRPLSVEAVGSPRERLRLPVIGYIHVRIGRDQNDRPLGMEGVSFRHDETGRIVGVRVRRGTSIKAGDPIGTLNRLNHVHLIAGPTAGEINALAVLQLPGISDTIAPVIENVTLMNESWQLFAPAGAKSPRVPVSGRVRIVVRAYDQADGNASYRRLGIYKLSYTVLKADGSPAEGFSQPRENLVFERLPATPNAVPLAYAEGSQSGYQGATIFAYIATNVLRDGEAREDFWDTTRLSPGDYTVRVIAADFFGNKTQRDVAVAVSKQ
ncbi:MAG TPA: hypothetical protein VFD58_01120 [Blastocatellia bacterium]|nr:hypothetical protein [Blastocatellia bacterium]